MGMGKYKITHELLMLNITAIATEKPQPDGLALACQNYRPGQSCWKVVTLAWPIWAQVGLAPHLKPGQAHHYSRAP